MPDRRVCPVILRWGGSAFVFRHPQAGVQLVKGRIEAGERPVRAARRELCEESGLHVAARPWRQWQTRIGAQVWHFVLWRSGRFPARWSHQTQDDGGHLFRFFWHPLNRKPNRDWHPQFRQALHKVQRHA